MQNPDKIFGRLSNRMFQMAALYAYCRDNNYPIFVQDEKYFKKYETEIRQLYGDGIVSNSVNKVAIHRRLGKNPINPQEPAYNENPFYVDLGHHEHQKLEDNYFMKAISYMQRWFNNPDLKFTVFSDNLEQAKREPMFQGEQFEFSEDRSEVGDMNYMASHKGIIMSNSSFSWWSAYLGQPQKVIVPAKWFSNPEDEKFIGLPNTWIKI